jgi:hypothetical protein
MAAGGPVNNLDRQTAEWRQGQNPLIARPCELSGSLRLTNSVN